jgi:hypothetical protein
MVCRLVENSHKISIQKSYNHRSDFQYFCSGVNLVMVCSFKVCSFKIRASSKNRYDRPAVQEEAYESVNNLAVSCSGGWDDFLYR